MATGETAKELRDNSNSPRPVAKRKGAFLLDKKLIERLLAERHILYRRDFAVMFGGVCPGLFLSQLFYWGDKGRDENGWIYKTMEDWTKETGMSRKELERARRILKEHGVLEEKRGVSRMDYRIDMDVLIQKLADFTKSPDGAVREEQEEPSETSELDDTNITEITQRLPINKKAEPDSDPQRSAPAKGTPGYQEAYKHVYQNPKDNKPVDIMKKYKDPSLREPNPKVEAAFRKLGSLSMREGNEDVADANPGYKLNCMSCGVMTEFKDKDEAMEGDCKKCGKPIFKEAGL